MHTYDYVCIILIYLLYTHIIIYMHVQFDIWRFINTWQHTVLVAPSTSDLFPPGEPWGHASWQAVHTAQWGYDYWGAVIRVGVCFGLRRFLVDNCSPKKRGKQPVTTKHVQESNKNGVCFSTFWDLLFIFWQFFFPKNHWMISGSSSTKTGPSMFSLLTFPDPSHHGTNFEPLGWIHMDFFCPRKVLVMTRSVFF